ncbi:hypothetical protein [Lacinutrix sp. Bg11-31]|uniref:hypothetical protein n=1 Tax=Lacinutrix sp. Bg11-31 TaxID=2057808 RepID=UPI000C317ACD|nr:hypothetical protein [Lacinutrix sp. Bg11-31]AUC81645.1 hypothetical protein CW733_05670 [Lacinutrix sp. Bg11-31]
MKKLALPFLMLFLSMSLFTCDNEPLESSLQPQGQTENLDCLAATQSYITAVTAFADWDGNVGTEYTVLCNAYASSLQGIIDNCGDPSGSFQAILTTLGDCSEPLDPDTCETAIANSAIAEANLNNATSDMYAQFCNAYVLALQEQIVICGDADGSIQVTIDGLGDCSETVPNADIVGTWLLTAWNGDAIDLNNDGDENINFLDEMDCYTNETLVFNSDNTGTAMSTSYATFTFEIEAGTTNSYIYTIECEDEIENSNFTWTQNGNIVSITDTATSDVSDWAINGNDLSTDIPSGFIAFDSDDFTVVVTQDLTFVYEKQ